MPPGFEQRSSNWATWINSNKKHIWKKATLKEQKTDTPPKLTAPLKAMVVGLPFLLGFGNFQGLCKTSGG